MHKLLALGSLAAFASGCLSSGGDDLARDQLAKQRALFENRGGTRYYITERQSCFCGPDTTAEMRVLVDHDTIVSAVFTENQKAVPEGARGQIMTIPEVFDFLEDKLGNHEYVTTAAYDAVDHYPTEASSYAPRLPDSGLTVLLSDFVPAAIP